ncbi:hypothetical protein XENOCAPTIV_014544, partial [Xenoophorus captivus]
QPLEDQGPLDLIIHKLTDLILEADQNDSQAVLQVQRVQDLNEIFSAEENITLLCQSLCWNINGLEIKMSPDVFLRFQDYIDAHPETIVLDPLPSIRTLLDRCKSYQLIHRIEKCMQGKSAADWLKAHEGLGSIEYVDK